MPNKPTEADLPDEIRALLGTPCSEEPCEQCPPSPYVTCQLSPKGVAHVWVPAQIANAERGHLIMVPGAGDGTIGALLAALVPAQHFTHMGIVTRDRVELRHCTGSKDFLEEHPYPAGPGTVSHDNPTDGFSEFAVRYGWPGTVTQSVELAYRASIGQNDGVDIPYQPADPKYPGMSTHIPSTKLSSTVLGDELPVTGMDFEPVQAPVGLPTDADAMLDAIVAGDRSEQDLQAISASATITWQTFWPLVVKPCPHNLQPHIVDALRRVAAAAEFLHGHYRFHAYVDAHMAENPSVYGPPMGEPARPDPERPCAPPIIWDHSLPLVCSTFVWEAVQEANRRANGPRIFLTQPWDHHPLHNCPSFYQPPVGADHPAPDDGLFDYDERGTARAAISLAAAIERDIVEKQSTLPWWLSWLGDVYEGFTDIMDDVTNQMCNAFAFDRCDPMDSKDDDNWRHPPPSRSVSPDNIIRSWFAPLDPSRTDEIHGLYGYNEQAIFRPGHYEMRRTKIRAFSPGPGRVEGLVKYAGKAVHGALVTIACHSTHTNADGFYSLEVPSGLYMLKGGAYLAQPAGEPAWYIEAEMETTVPYGTLEWFPDLVLQDPPGENRIVQVTGHADLVNRHTFGKDWWDHPAMNFRLIHLGNFGTAEGQANRSYWGSAIDFSYNVGVEVTAKRAEPAAGDPYPIDIHVKAILGAKGIAGWPFTPDATNEFDVHLATDAVSPLWSIDLKTGGIAPVRAHLEIVFANHRQG